MWFDVKFKSFLGDVFNFFLKLEFLFYLCFKWEKEREYLLFDNIELIYFGKS